MVYDVYNKSIKLLYHNAGWNQVNLYFFFSEAHGVLFGTFTQTLVPFRIHDIFSLNRALHEVAY